MVYSIDIPTKVDINELVARVATAENDIAHLQNTVAHLQSSINALNVTLADTQANIDQLCYVLQNAGRMLQNTR